MLNPLLAFDGIKVVSQVYFAPVRQCCTVLKNCLCNRMYSMKDDGMQLKIYTRTGDKGLSELDIYRPYTQNQQ